MHLYFSPGAINVFACAYPISQSLTKAQGKHTGFSNLTGGELLSGRLLEFPEFLSYSFQYYNNK